MNAADYYDSVSSLWDGDDFPEERFARHVTATLSIPHGGGLILDVGCGSGAMFSELGDCGASEIVGLDISPRMAELARKRAKYDPRVSVLQEDFLLHMMPNYDVIIAYNSYNHFIDPIPFLYRSHILLQHGGRLTIAFPASYEMINVINRELPSGIVRKIASADREALLWEQFFKVDCICDNEQIYLISGRSR